VECCSHVDGVEAPLGSMATVIGGAAHAMAVTFAMIATGTMLRASRVVSLTGQREMSQVAVKLLLPAFNFSALVSDVSWERLEVCRGIAVFAVIHMVMGLTLGAALCHLGKSSEFLREHRGQVMVLCAFCNGTAMPLTLFRALVASQPQLQWMEAEGALDITIYGTVWRMLLWTVGIALLEADAARQAASKHSISLPQLGRAALLNSNTLASALGLAVALGPPPLRALLFGGPLTFLREAAANVAKASHTMLLLTLGAALWPVPKAHDWQAVGGVCAVKLVAMPLATLFLLRFSLFSGAEGARGPFALGDVGSLVVGIEGCVPSALQISMMVQHTKQDPQACTVVCFWEHIVALLTMTVFLALALAGIA